MRTKFHLLLSLLLLASIFTDAKAETFTRCDSCTNTRAAALNSTSFEWGQTEIVNVVDLTNFTIETYSVNAFENKRRPGTTITIPFPQATSEANLRYVEALREFKENAEKLDIPAYIVESGWDLHSNGHLQTQFLDYVYANAGFTELSINLVNQISSLISFDPIVIMVTLLDGSQVALVYSHTALVNGELLGMYKIDFSKSIDRYGNPMTFAPDETTSGGGGVSVTFPTGGVWLQSFLAAAIRAGLVVDMNNQNSTTTVCVLNGNVMTCTGY